MTTQVCNGCGKRFPITHNWHTQLYCSVGCREIRQEDHPTCPPNDSIELPATIRDLEHFVDKYAYANQGRRELSIFSHGGRMYVCRDEDVERLRACLAEASP
jgi:hypothetical protein